MPFTHTDIFCTWYIKEIVNLSLVIQIIWLNFIQAIWNPWFYFCNICLEIWPIFVKAIRHPWFYFLRVSFASVVFSLNPPCTTHQMRVLGRKELKLSSEEPKHAIYFHICHPNRRMNSSQKCSLSLSRKKGVGSSNLPPENYCFSAKHNHNSGKWCFCSSWGVKEQFISRYFFFLFLLCNAWSWVINKIWTNAFPQNILNDHGKWQEKRVERKLHS